MNGRMYQGEFDTVGELMEASVKGLTAALAESELKSGEVEIYDFEGFKVVIHVAKQPVEKQ